MNNDPQFYPVGYWSASNTLWPREVSIGLDNYLDLNNGKFCIFRWIRTLYIRNLEFKKSLLKWSYKHVSKC